MEIDCKEEREGRFPQAWRVNLKRVYITLLCFWRREIRGARVWEIVLELRRTL